jgi:hypothetical protein
VAGANPSGIGWNMGRQFCPLPLWPGWRARERGRSSARARMAGTRPELTKRNDCLAGPPGVKAFQITAAARNAAMAASS